ncbi:MAG: DUF2127 domain-containing protein [Terriglobales bacterium]
MHSRSNTTSLRLIAVFKLFKAALLIVVAISALKLIHKDVGDVAERWAEALRLDSGNRFIDAAIQKASNLTPQHIKALSLGSMIYAALFLTEGLGLWFQKRWAEWLTVIITSSLLPIEIYEIFRRETPMKFVVLAINIAIVAYLIVRIRAKDH